MEPTPHQKSAEEHRRFLEEEMELRKNSRDLYEKMLWSLDGDNFDEDENKKEAEALTQELFTLFSDLKKDKSRRWADKINDLEEFKARSDKFLKKTGAFKKEEDVEKEETEKGEAGKEEPVVEPEEKKEQKKKKEEEKKQEEEARKKQQEDAKKAEEEAERKKEQDEKDKKSSVKIKKAAKMDELYKIIRGIGEIKSLDGEVDFSPEESIKQLEGARAKMRAMTVEEFKEELASEEKAIKFITPRAGIREKFVALLMDEKISDKNTERNENRSKYAEEEYKTYNVVSKIKRFLGIKYDSQKVDSVNAHYKDYKVANTELLDLKLERLKRRDLTEAELKREMGDLVKEFDINEKVNVYAAHTDARGKVWEEKFGKAPGWIAKKCAQAVNGYRKMPLKKKLLISAALFVGGGGIATVAGLAGVSSASLGILGGKLLTGTLGASVLGFVRGLGSASAGVGMGAFLETKKIRKDNKKSAQFNEEILKNAEKETDKFAFVMNKLSGIDYQESFKIEKKSANIRRAAGIVTAAGMFFLPKIIIEKMGFGGHVGQHAATGELEKAGDLKTNGSLLPEDDELMFGTEKEDIIPGPASGVVPEDVGKPGAVVAPDATVTPEQIADPKDALETEAEKFVKWAREGGFDNNANAPVGTEDLQGGAEAATAESMRDRVGAQAWDAMDQPTAVQHDTIEPSEGSFSPPEGATSLHETVQSSGEVVQPEATGVPEEVVNNPRVRVVPDVIPDEIANHPKVRVVPDNIIEPKDGTIPDVDRTPGDSFNHNMDQFLDDTERELFNAERGYGGNYGPAMSPTPGPGIESAWFENTKFSRDVLADFSDKINAGNPEKALEVFQEKIAPDGAWDKIKDMSFTRATMEMGWNKDEKMEVLFRNMKKIFGDSIAPRNGLISGETMGDWTKRVADTAMKR